MTLSLAAALSGDAPSAGAAAALAVAALWGFAPVAYKRLLARIAPRSLVVFYALIVAVAVGAWAWAYRADVAADARRLRAADWALLAAAALAGGFAANVLYAHLLAAYDAYWATGLAYAAPLFAAALAWAWLGERPTPLGALGIALIAAGAGLLVADGGARRATAAAGAA